MATVVVTITLGIMTLGFLGNAVTHSFQFVTTTESLAGAAICFVCALVGFSLVK